MLRLIHVDNTFFGAMHPAEASLKFLSKSYVFFKLEFLQNSLILSSFASRFFERDGTGSPQM